MNNPEQSSEIGRREDFRVRTSKQIEGYLREGLSVSEMAQILNAKDFIGVERKKGKEYTHFRVKEYVDDLISKGANLQLPEAIIQSGELILPPDAGEIQQAITGEHEFEKPKYIPRTQFLMEVLSDMQIPYSVISGRNDPNMVRKLSYQTFILQGESKIVMVNNEEGNATYVIKDVENPKENWKDYSSMTKQQLQELKDRVAKINYSGELIGWKERLSTELANKMERAKKPRNTKRIIAKGLDTLPEGWDSATKLAHNLGVDFSVIRRELDELDIENKTRCFRNDAGQAHSYISPEAITIITSKIHGRTGAPDDWKTMGELANETGLDISTIQRKLDKYVKDNSSGVKKFKSRKTNSTIQYASPDFCSMLKSDVKDLQKYSTMPDGWMTMKALSRVLGKDRTSVVKMADRFRKDHPNWFGVFLVHNNVSECVSPDLVEKINEEIAQTSEIPNGWKNSHEIFIDIKKNNPSITYLTVYNLIHEYVKNHEGPEFVRDLRKGGKLLQFYSPIVIEEINFLINNLKPKD